MDHFLTLESEAVRHNLINLKQIVFEVTERCNLNCRYCGLADMYNGNQNRNTRQLSFRKARLLIEYLASLWKENHSEGSFQPVTVSFYGGEPLLNMLFIKNVISCLEQLPDTGKYFHYGMTTNAMLLDRHMDYLAEKHFHLLISLDGDKAAHSYRTDHAGNNSFCRVFGNIKRLQEKYPDYFRQLVTFNSVLHNRNNVETTHRFIMDNFGKAPTISPLNNSGILPEKIDEFREMYRNKMDSMTATGNCEAIESEVFISAPRIYELAQYIYKQSGNVFSNFNELLFDFTGMDMFPTGTCTPFLKKMFITAGGDILQCEKIDHDFVLGHIHDDRVDLDCQAIADHYNRHVSKCLGQCANCADSRQCSQCVYNMDDIREENPHCRNFCSRKEVDRKKQKTTDFLREHPYYYEKILKEVVIRN
ncbi:MAG: radical SAM peptide maturase [Tannerella sp.]|jgi:uncharacterized protein|nr:radical SAM peptide maturase [Tannerella sp.]